MSRTCKITGKGTISGHKVSHSQTKSKRTFRANIQSKRLINPATGTMMRIKLSTSAMRTLKKWQIAGKKYDLRELIKDKA
jgi:large subunit ribosomal protein L28